MITIGNATVNLSTDTYEGGEYAGEGTWTFEYDAFEAIPQGFEHRYIMGSGERGADSIRGMIVDECGDLEIGESFSVGNADLAIVILATLGHVGGEFDVSYEGADSEFWAFHDFAHARHSTTVDDGGAEIFVDGGEEDETHVRGGLEALRHGVPLAEIVRAIASSEGDFRERFGYESTALDSLLSRVEVSVPEES